MNGSSAKVRLLKLGLMVNICVLITVFNRKENTLSCLDKLFNSFNLYNKGTSDLDVFLVDDGSTDNTFEAVQSIYPDINLISGDGSLYWNRGMILAWETAKANKNYDFYIWLNNDVEIFHHAFTEIFSCSKELHNECIISGIINSNEAEVIYGGRNHKKELLKPNGNCQSLKYLNGNFVLIPNNVFEQLGYLDNKFHHDLGDVDYGFRAIDLGIGVVTSKSALGSGEINKIIRSRKSGLSISKRFKHLLSPLGYPLHIAFYFHNKHYNLFKAILFVLFLITINMLSDNLYYKVVKGK